METAKLIMVLCCAYNSMASHSHTIPVDEYETTLTDLGQHIEIPETPVKVIKITKTVAVKVPVPYPVKIIEKVPYPVHIAKPYPVHVPQIVEVPAPSHKVANHKVANEGASSYQGAHDSPAYNVNENEHPQEQFSPLSMGDAHSFDGGNGGYGASVDEHSSDGHEGSHDGQPNAYYGYHPGSNDGGSLEAKNYDKAIEEYLSQLKSGEGEGYHYR